MKISHDNAASAKLDEEFMLVDLDEADMQLRDVPSCIKAMLSLNARFFQYDVAYGSEDDVKAQMQNAEKCKVAVALDMMGGAGGNDVETCEGPLANCLVFLKDYLAADNGYQGALALEILDKAFSDEDFTLFCVWMNQWLPDWIDGIKDNDVMKWHFKQDIADEMSGQELDDIGSAQRLLGEGHPVLDDPRKETFGRNQRDILRQAFDLYGAKYSADAFVAFARELAEQDPLMAKRLRKFFGQFASGSLDSKHDPWTDAAGNCRTIAKSLVAMLGAALEERHA